MYIRHQTGAHVDCEGAVELEHDWAVILQRGLAVGFCRKRHRVGRHTQKNVAIHTRRSWGLSSGQIAYVLRACAGYRRRAQQLRADDLGAACCQDLF
eukprot:scaffold93_cov112-Isochrysis_galbana.AAC.1